MSSLSERPWLTWAPPVIVAVVVVLALQFGGGGTASPDAVDSAVGTDPTSPVPTTAGSGVGAGGDSTSTTGFAQRTPTLPDDPFDYGNDLPAHVEVVSGDLPSGLPLSEVDTAVVAGPVTDEGATLGRVLFYDVNLSVNRTVRCASCHVQVHSFTDPLVRSQGIGGQRTRRNSMSLANARFNASGRFLWDERAATLEDQVIMPFLDPLEMGLTEPMLIDRIAERPYYEPLFVEAFGDGEVTLDRVAVALGQFIRAMVSLESRYDEGRAQVTSPLDPFPNFTDAENEGKRLFFNPIADGGGSCSSCHTGEAQIDSPRGLNNNGIDPPSAEFVAPDLGAFEATGEQRDAGRFRVPSLRNVEVTAPYMHDGRLTSLDDVIAHYDSGIEPHENLSSVLRDARGEPVRLGFDEGERAALVAFLRTLTDDRFLTDERFSEPFRAP